MPAPEFINPGPVLAMLAGSLGGAQAGVPFSPFSTEPRPAPVQAGQGQQQAPAPIPQMPLPAPPPLPDLSGIIKALQPQPQAPTPHPAAPPPPQQPQGPPPITWTTPNGRPYNPMTGASY